MCLEEPGAAFPAALAVAEAVIDHVDVLSVLVGRKVQNWNEFPGKVNKSFVQNQEFQLQHYDAENPGKTTKKLMKVTHGELLELILGDDDGELDDEILPEEEEELLDGDGNEEVEEAPPTAVAASLPP